MFRIHLSLLQKYISKINITVYIFSYDFLSVYDGDTPLDLELGSLTGILPPNVASSGPDIYISFTSDGSETSSGFIIQYDAGKK